MWRNLHKCLQPSKRESEGIIISNPFMHQDSKKKEKMKLMNVSDLSTKSKLYTAKIKSGKHGVSQ